MLRTVIPCSRLDLLGRLRGSIGEAIALLAARRARAPTSAGPSPCVSPAASISSLVVGRVPGLEDHRLRARSPRSGCPHSSLVVKSIGPTIRSRPRSRSQSVGGVEQRARRSPGRPRTRRSRTCPSLPPWNSFQRAVDLGGDPARPRSPSRPARKYSASRVLEVGVLLAGSGTAGARRSAAAPTAGAAVEPKRQLDEALQVAPRLRPAGPRRVAMAARYTCDTSGACADTAQDPGRRLREGAHPRPRSSSSKPPRRRDLLPYFRLLEPRRPGPVVEMEGRETIMLGSNNYLGPDRRRAGQAGARATRSSSYGTGAHRLAPAERDHPPARRARARARRVDGDRGRDRLHDRLPGEPRRDRHDPRARRHRRSATPATTPRSSTAAGSPAPSCAPSATTGWTSWRRCWSGPPRTAAACWSSSTASSRWRATSATCRAIVELCQALRGAADGRRGPRRRRPRRARRRRLRAVRPRGRGRPADGHLLQEPRLLRRLHRRARPT